MTRRTAKHAVLSIKPTGSSLTFDGEEFPYDIAAEEIVVNQAGNGLSTVTLTILVESVTVDADLTGTIRETKTDKNGWPATPEAALGMLLLVSKDTPQPPIYVTCLHDFEAKHNGALVYLVRCHNNKWAWESTPSVDPNKEGLIDWSDFVKTYDGLGLRVESIK